MYYFFFFVANKYEFDGERNHPHTHSAYPVFGACAPQRVINTFTYCIKLLLLTNIEKGQRGRYLYIFVRIYGAV